MKIARHSVGGSLLVLILACSGIQSPEDGSPDPGGGDAGGDEGGGGSPVDVPDRLAQFLPTNLRPAEVGKRDGVSFVRYDDLSLTGVAAAWPASLQVQSKTEDRLVAAYWADEAQQFGLVTAEKSGGGATIRHVPVVPDSGLERGSCDDGQVAVSAPWDGDTLVHGCVKVGAPPRPVGKFRIEAAGVALIEGEYGPGGERTGRWTLRDDGGRVVSTGEFADDRPFGRWVFGDESDPDAAIVGDIPTGGHGAPQVQSFAFVDGQTTDAPLAYLPVTSSDPHPYAEPATSLVDADLLAGWVHLTATYKGASHAGRNPQACPPDGTGERRLNLRPDRRQPAGEVQVAALAFDGEACTTPEAAEAARTEASSAFAGDVHPQDPPPASLIGPAQQLELKAGKKIGFPLPFEGENHTLGWRVDGSPMGLEEQLAEPELLDGRWVADEGQTVHRIEILLDQTPIDQLWVRWPTSCPDQVWVEGMIVQGRLVAPLYRTDPCDQGSRWVVGEVLEIAPPEPGD